jgi:hypothetical protein
MRRETLWIEQTCYENIYMLFMYPSVAPLALAPLLRSCKDRLEVLKVAGISSRILSHPLFEWHML